MFDGAAPLPPLSARSSVVVDRYRRHRDSVRKRGVTVGRARLAMDSPQCVRCGLCLTGCPYDLIYSAPQTLDALRREGRIAYHDGLLAIRVADEGHGAVVFARELNTGRVQRFAADRVLVTCGGLGSSQIALYSLELFGQSVRVAESAHLVLPFCRRHG